MLMEEDDDGKQERGELATELERTAKAAMVEGGSSYENVSLLIQDIYY